MLSGTRTKACIGGVAALLGATPAPALAQLELVFDAGVGMSTAGDFVGTPSGPALGLALHLADWSSARAGLEVGYGRHRGEGIESATTQVEFLALARYVVPAGPVELSVGGKVGVARRSLIIVEEPATSEGFIVGPSAALRLPIGPLHVQLTAEARYETYEELWMHGQFEYGTDENGLRMVYRAGLAIPLTAPGSGGERR